MKRTALQWIMVAVLLVLGQAVQAQSAYDWIETHRKWMSEHYPKGEELSKEALLKEAAFAVLDGLREPEAKALLRVAEKWVPQLGAYLNWLESGQVDEKYAILLGTLKGVADAAEEQLGREHVVTGWCRYLYLSQLVNMEDVVKPTDELIGMLQQAVKQKPDRETKALLCIVKLSQFTNRMRNNLVDDPRDYEDVLRTEQEALALYPADDKTVDHTRAFLYFTLAQVKSSMSQVDELKLAQERVGGIENTPYKSLANGTISNVGFYFEKAVLLYRQLYSEGHPELVMIRRCQLNFEINSQLLNEELEEACRTAKLYADTYYSAESSESLLARLDWWMARWKSGMKNHDAIFCSQMVEGFKRYLGEDNSYYLNMLTNVVLIAVYDYPFGADRLLDEWDQTMERIYSGQPLKKAYMLYWLYSSVRDRQPEKAKARLEEAYALYREYYDGSLLSMIFGRLIVWESYTVIGDMNLTQEIQAYVCEAARACFGKESPVSLNEELFQLIVCQNEVEKEEQVRAAYPQLIERMRKQGADYQVAMANYAEFLFGIRDYRLAEEQYALLVENATEEDPCAQRANFLLRLAYIRELMNKDSRDCDRLFEEGKKLLVRGKEEPDVWMENYQTAAQYLIERGRYQEAVTILDEGIDLCLERNGDNIYDMQYLGMFTLKIQLMYSGLNEMVEAKQLMVEQMEKMFRNKDVPGSLPLLDYLWGCYYLVKGENAYNMVQRNEFLMPLLQVSQMLYAQNGQDPLFMMNYVTPLLIEFLDIATQSMVWTKNMDVDALHENDRAVYEKQMKYLKGMFPNVKEIFGQLEQIFREQDKNFSKNVTYRNLVRSQILYYQHMEYNEAERDRCLLAYRELVEQQETDDWDAWFDLGDLYWGMDKKQEAVPFYEKAYEQLTSSPRVTVNDKLKGIVRLCNTYVEERKWKEMVAPARAFYANVKEMMDGNFQLMTESEQNNFMDTYRDPAMWLTCLLEQMPEELAAEVYDAVLYRTGMQLRSQRQTRMAILASKDTALIRLVEQMNRLQLERKNFKVDYGVLGLAFNEQMQSIGKLTYEIDALERQLIERSEPYRRRYATEASWHQIREKLKNDEAAIEFVFSREYIMALVLKKNSRKPIPVRLGKNEELMKGLQALDAKTSARMAVKLYNERALDLYALLWAPLEPYLKGVRTVYYATPGILNNLSFAAFATPDGGYLIDKYDLCPLTTTAMLLRPQSDERPQSALLMGNIFYSEKQRLLAGTTNAEQVRGTVDDFGIDDFEERGVSKDHFKYLPFTNREVEDITAELGRNNWNMEDITVKKGMEASEQALKELAATGPAVIHLATHGFFVANRKQALDIPFFQNREPDYAMYRAGVALANAETAWCGKGTDTGENDGILTADEVSRLNLQHTQLVVLSACETALGNYSYEGVFGLPRGFKQAGVRSLLVSLWSVNDHSTSLLMSAFYRYWLEGLSKREALRKATDEVRKVYPQPFYWAPFVLLDAN